MNWQHLPRPVALYALMLAMIAACTLLGLALLGLAVLDWPEQAATAIGTVGLLLGITAAVVFERSGLADTTGAIRESDRLNDAWIAAITSNAPMDEIDALYDAWRVAYAREARARRGEVTEAAEV